MGMPGPYEPQMAQQMGTTTVIVQQPIGAFGPTPQPMTCPICRNNIITGTRPSPGLFTYIMSSIICVAFCPLMWLPCCIDMCQDTEHICPACNSVVGKRVIL